MSGAIHAQRKAHRRRDVLFAMCVLGAVAVFTLLILWLQGLANDLRDANDARDALARQVQQLGGKPVAGPPGSRGQPGRSVTGPTGPRGEPGESVVGPRGPRGSPGKDGRDGKNGADSTVPGPSGAPGENATGAPGPAGKDGSDGRDGADGKDGRDGQPPVSWTFSYGGVVYTCQRSDGFDANEPTYSCNANEPQPGPSPSGQGSPVLGLGPERRRY